MADEKFEHPLDRQNAIEREIQLEGPKDPENFKMPDGRTLAEVRQANEEIHQKEFIDEAKMIGARTREMSAGGLTKGKNLVVSSVGNIIDVTPPPEIEKREYVPLAHARSSAADQEPPEDFEASKSGEPFPSAAGQSGFTPASSTLPPSSTPTEKSSGEISSEDIGLKGGIK
jgi:hypothetical protein